MNKLPPREDIPEPVKRIVRQQAGFGCCRCGRWIFQYHHIVERSEEPEDIMLLCPNCHDEATKGAMKLEEQRRYKANPFNIAKGFAQGSLKIDHDVPVLEIGTVQLVHEGDLIIVDGLSLLSLYIDSGRLELSLKLHDPAGQLLAEIERNQWKSGDPFPWDIESSYQWLTIRHKKRLISLDIDARTFPMKLRANLWHNKQHFGLDTCQIRFNGIVRYVGFASLCLVALQFVADTSTNKFALVLDPRFVSGALISEPDVPKRIRMGLEAWRKLERKNTATQP